MEKIDQRKKRQIIIKLLLKQNNKCYYCNKQLKKRSDVTLDHITPYCEVGNNTEFAVACQQCNIYKGNISEELYRDGYICCNIKYGIDLQSENKAIKVRNKINWFQKTFPSIFKWNKKYKITIKEYV